MTHGDQDVFRNLLRERRESFLDWLSLALPDEPHNGSRERIIRNLERALERVGKGDLGNCEVCRGDLERELVAACPESTICLDCLGVRERRQLEEDLRLAQEVNQSLLPRLGAGTGSWDVGIHYQPSRILSGDFYDVALLPQAKTLRLALGDVAGKGIPAGLLRTSLQATLRALAHRHRSPAELLEETNRHFYATSHPGRFATVFYGLLASDQGVLVYANGGHLPPLLRRASGIWESLDPTGAVLGVLEDLRYRDASSVIEPGDLLVVYSDGITEAQDSSGGYYDEHELKNSVERAAALPAQDLADRIAADVDRFSPGPPSDDRTLLVLKREATPQGMRH